MHESGRVITVHDGAVDVRMEVASDCKGCSVCSHSGNGETVMRDVRDTIGAKVGDSVEVLIPDAVRSRAAAAVFVVPVLCMLLGYLAGFLLGRWAGIAPDVGGLIGALACANIAVLGVRRAEKRLSSDEQFVPKVNAIIARGHDRT